MKLHVIALALMIGLTPSLTYAQGGGGGGGGGGGAGGGGSASGASAGAGSSAAGSPAAGSAGAGSLGTNGVPPGPANSAGLNNSGNDPSGSGNTPRFNSGTTTGLANPAPATPSNGDVRNSPTTPPGIELGRYRRGIRRRRWLEIQRHAHAGTGCTDSQGGSGQRRQDRRRESEARSHSEEHLQGLLRPIGKTEIELWVRNGDLRQICPA